MVGGVSFLLLVEFLVALAAVEVEFPQDLDLVGEEGLGTVLEVGMAECLLKGDALLRVPAQHPAEQVQTVAGSMGEDVGQPVLAEDAALLGGLAEVPPLLVEKLGPVVLGGVADGLADELELVDFGAALQEGHPLPQELGDDAADGPGVHGLAVVLDPDEEFGRAVPEGDYLAGEGTVGLLYKANSGVTKLAGESEVCDLEDALLVDEEVGEFEVAVDDVLGVGVTDLVLLGSVPL